MQDMKRELEAKLGATIEIEHLDIFDGRLDCIYAKIYNGPSKVFIAMGEMDAFVRFVNVSGSREAPDLAYAVREHVNFFNLRMTAMQCIH